MFMTKSISFIYSSLFVLVLSCNPVEKNQQVERKNQDIPNEVKVEVVDISNFENEIISNGKLHAIRKSEIRFRVSESVQNILVKNGDEVEKGEIIAKLNDFELRNKVEKAMFDLTKAQLTMSDQLIGRGYDPNNQTLIPKDILAQAQVLSGYSEAKNNLEMVTTKLTNTKLRAPFRGKVSSLKIKKFDFVSEGDSFCTLVDDSSFEVEFKIIESELKSVELGNDLVIRPFYSESTFGGQVTSINPQVDENGMILISGSVTGDLDLIDGMNVEIIVKSVVENHFVVPKSAVVIRQNYPVLFKLVDGKAFWTYIDIMYENSNSYAVQPDSEKSSANLNKGDTVIISGNLNLAHESEVVISNSN